MNRICYVIPSLSVGGTEKQLIELIRCLARDNEITVVCTHHAGALAGDARRVGAVVHTLDLWGGWDPRARRALRHLFRRHRPDILHTFLSGFDLAANRAARETGVPVVLSSRRELAAWKKPRHVRVQRKANAYVDCIVANSRAVAEFAVNQEGASPSLFRVIPNGVRAEQFEQHGDPHITRQHHHLPWTKHIVGFVANFSPVKDHALFLETAGELLSRRDDIHFLMVGSGPLQEQIERRIAQKGWIDHFARTATLGELSELYAVMGVSVNFSKVEGFPNALMESMAVGVPVVAPAVGGIPELIEDRVTGRLIASREPRDFADAIDWALDRPEESRPMAERGKAYVKTHFSLDRMVDAYKKLYTELLVKSSRNGA